MRIKRVEIIGFKSFCDRAVVQIGEQITGVVGPNGCGKSNIVDAIRWCMGEQSAKHLRGKAMEDVIFNGSESRAPAPMAEVSLTFDDVGFSHETLELGRQTLADEQELAALTGEAEDGPAPEADGDAEIEVQAEPETTGTWLDKDGNKIASPVEEVQELLEDKPPAFEFSHYTEVTITRRLYRDGISQYFINKSPCRLRDITDFFLGTGVGTKAYAIIEQGRIGQIVSARPQDRRAIIEEAAGITKFKSKKKAAERKLEQTRQNLMRVSDIVSELDKRMGTLRRQAQKAERYRKYKSEMKDIELWKASHRWLELAGEYALVSGRLAEVRTELETVRTEWAVKDATVVAERADLVVEERRLLGVQEKVYELDNKIRLGDSKIGFELREADDLEHRIANARTEIDQVLAQRERGQLELDQRKTELETLEADVTREQGEVREREAAASEARQMLVNAEGRLEETRVQIADCKTRMATSQAQLEALAHRRGETAGRFERVSGEVEQMAKGAKELERDLRRVDGALAELRQTRLDLGTQNDGFAARREHLATEVSRGEAEVETLRNELNRRRSRLVSLEEIQARYEGFARGTRAVMQGADSFTDQQLRNVRGVVADMVRAPELLEVAVEAALGDRLGGVLVSEASVGVAAIGYLKQHNGGRSAFVSLTTRSVDTTIRDHSAGVPEPVGDDHFGEARFQSAAMRSLGVPNAFEGEGNPHRDLSEPHALPYATTPVSPKGTGSPDGSLAFGTRAEGSAPTVAVEEDRVGGDLQLRIAAELRARALVAGLRADAELAATGAALRARSLVVDAWSADASSVADDGVIDPLVAGDPDGWFTGQSVVDELAKHGAIEVVGDPIGHSGVGDAAWRGHSGLTVETGDTVGDTVETVGDSAWLGHSVETTGDAAWLGHSVETAGDAAWLGHSDLAVATTGDAAAGGERGGLAWLADAELGKLGAKLRAQSLASDAALADPLLAGMLADGELASLGASLRARALFVDALIADPLLAGTLADRDLAALGAALRAQTLFADAMFADAELAIVARPAPATVTPADVAPADVAPANVPVIAPAIAASDELDLGWIDELAARDLALESGLAADAELFSSGAALRARALRMDAELVEDEGLVRELAATFLQELAPAAGQRTPFEFEDRSHEPVAGVRNDDDVVGEGVIGRIADLIGFADGYAEVGRRLLGRTVVVDHLQRAIDLHERGVSDRLVTLDGDVVDEDGIVAGGSRDAQGAGVLAQKREIRELHEIVGTLEHDLSEAMQRLITAKSELAQVTKAIEGLRKQVHEGEVAIVGHEKDDARVRGELDRQRDRLGNLTKEQLELEERLATIVSDEGSHKDKLARADEEQRTAEQLQLDLIALLGGHRDRLEELAQALTEVRVRAAQLEAQRSAVESATLRLAQTDAELAVRLERLQTECEESAQRATALREGCDQLAAELARTREERAGESQILEEGRTAYQARVDSLSEIELDARDLRTRGDALQSELGQLELRQGQIAMTKKVVEDQVSERYQLDMADVLPEFHQRGLVGDAEDNRLTELRELIERMGTDINLTAIDEFADVSKRFEFLSAQQIDLDRAVDQLQRAIDKINKTSRKLFKDTFTAVNATFKEVFPRLFRGGHAALSLSSDETDILEAGVEIFAQPPGKKNVTVDQLSGGEKALTAVALVFSIFLIKPSPFCILDEVDAPLDEANVDRYNEIVREMTDRSQFIVITHNKRTMEAADNLYGVTMQEPGVSKLVNVNLARIGGGAADRPTTKSITNIAVGV